MDVTNESINISCISERQEIILITLSIQNKWEC